MMRRNAIAASAASAMVLASIAVTAYTVTDDGARGDGVGELAAARRTTETVVQEQVVDDLVYATSDTVPTTSTPGAVPGAPAAPAPPGTPTAPAASPSGDVGATSAGEPASSGTGSAPRAAAPRPAPRAATPTTTSPPRVTTTTRPPSAPTTTWPPGTELPEAWPAGVPYPPIPAGCRKPHLEDNGVWNCER
jgi:hypothetical protein